MPPIGLPGEWDAARRMPRMAVEKAYQWWRLPDEYGRSA